MINNLNSNPHDDFGSEEPRLTHDISSNEVSAATPTAEDLASANDSSLLQRKPVICIEPGAMKVNIELATRELGFTERYFQLAGRIVTLLVKPDTGEVEVQVATRHTLRRDLDEVIEWKRLNQRSNEWITCEPNGKYIQAMLEPSEHAGLPVLNGVSWQPHLRRDGTLCVASGYDLATGRYGGFKAKDFSVPAAPSQADAEMALAVLMEQLSEFPFVRDCDRSAALAAILTAAIRPSLPTAPMFHVKAAQISSGKSYLCDIISAFASAKPNSAASFPGSNEECRKVLLSQLRKVPAVIVFDNLTTDITAHQALCTMLTSEQMEDRVLSTNTMEKVSTRTLVLSNGNNVSPSVDMRRRCVTIELDPGVEIPATRTFKRANPLSDILAERGRFVSAALMIVAAWVAAGRPWKGLKPLGSYNEWSQYCREPLVWLGLADPATGVFEALADDPERALLGQVIDAIEANFETRPVMVKQMIERAQAGGSASEDLLEVLQEVAAEHTTINRKRLGHWIKAREGQIVDGRKIVAAPVKRNSKAWQVMRMGPQAGMEPPCAVGEPARPNAPDGKGPGSPTVDMSVSSEESDEYVEAEESDPPTGEREEWLDASVDQHDTTGSGDDLLE